jgi:hypothetical protein
MLCLWPEKAMVARLPKEIPQASDHYLPQEDSGLFVRRPQLSTKIIPAFLLFLSIIPDAACTNRLPDSRQEYLNNPGKTG